MSGEKLIGGNIILSKLTTNIRISQTRPNFSPIVRTCDSIPKPIREAIEAVLLVVPTRNVIATITARDDKGEDKENEKESYKDSHTEEVEGKETLFVPVGANEAGE